VKGDSAVTIEHRRQRCHWYRSKATTALADMHAAFRAALTDARINAIGQAHDQGPQIIGSTLTSEAEAA
jgi:hypothetical protein